MAAVHLGARQAQPGEKLGEAEGARPVLLRVVEEETCAVGDFVLERSGQPGQLRTVLLHY